MKYFWVLCAILFLASCTNNETESSLSPENDILQKSIANHFSTRTPHFSFDFRNRSYEVNYSENSFEYICSYSDTTGNWKRILNNSGYSEYLNGDKLSLSTKDSLSHAESVNSVSYFNLIPLVLSEPAVNTKLQPIESIEGKDYHKLEIRFQEQGGGKDFEDVFYYWLDTADYSIDYMAYSYLTDGGGTRFRKAMNQRNINGIAFQDYLNFKGPASPDSLPFIKDLYSADDLKLLSKIEIDAIRVMK